jgi:hypothetical protein
MSNPFYDLGKFIHHSLDSWGDFFDGNSKNPPPPQNGPWPVHAVDPSVLRLHRNLLDILHKRKYRRLRRYLSQKHYAGKLKNDPNFDAFIAQIEAVLELRKITDPWEVLGDSLLTLDSQQIPTALVCPAEDLPLYLAGTFIDSHLAQFRLLIEKERAERKRLNSTR